MADIIEPEPIPANDKALMLAAELGTVDDLVRYNCLTFEGLAHVHHKLLTAYNADIALTRPLLGAHLERVLHRCVIALSKASGMPAEYWSDRSLIAAPDDASGIA